MEHYEGQFMLQPLLGELAFLSCHRSRWNVRFPTEASHLSEFGK